MRFRDVALLEWSNIEGNILSYNTSKSGFKKKISFHTARHSFIDVLKKKGVSTEKRMQMVGHTSESVHRMYHGDFDVSEISQISHDLLT